MGRLLPIDRVVLLLAVPVWVLCFSLSVKSTFSGTALALIQVESPAIPNDYPTVIGELAFYYGPPTELRPGDRLQRLGQRDLRGVSAIADLDAVSRQPHG